ncbi:uncharacterized protein LOC124363088 isoform X1 [Homalodisca vitripennis]|uniref:uncharacterized protein LOC124363088 isoform X1 n=1 Tax=Homalodisca vitripennis TaxID=197043 RepID=UPI001EEBD714|nr:uncharacterized protein LOC124363088 isoform X1 [Homalodisca vitripennis]
MFTKKVKVKSLRNVLASPFHLQWLKKSEEEIAPVRDSLAKLLPAAKLERTQLSKQWKLSEVINEKNKVGSNKQHNLYRNYLALGFQSVIRGLEKKELCCVILSSEITPVSLQKVLVASAYTNGVPALVIPDLKKIAKSSLGFTTMVIGFKNIVSESPENQFYPVYRMISENPLSIDAPFLLSQKEDIISDQDVNMVFDEPSKKQQEKLIESLYLYRKTTNERVFVPENKKGPINENSSKNDTQKMDDFIHLDKAQVKIASLNDVKKELPSKTNSYDIDDEDDTDSCDDNIFFVDSKPDESLLSTEKQTINNDNMQWENSLKNRHKKETNRKSFSNNQVKSSQHSKSPNKSPGFNQSNVVNVQEKETSSQPVSHLKKKQKRLKLKTCNPSKVNFRPLLVMSVTNNSKKNKFKRNA